MATRFGKIPPRIVVPQPKATPLDMLTISIGGLVTQARPFEVSTDPKTDEQYPSKAVTSCPHCGHGIYFDIRYDQLVSHQELTAACDNCNAGVEVALPMLEDPFRNPVVDGFISRPEIDPLYGKPVDADTVHVQKNIGKKSPKKRKKATEAFRGTQAAEVPPSAPEVQEEPTESHDDIFGDTGSDLLEMGEEP